MASIHLRVLGRAVVERDGALVRGRAVQSHHLALLALLAASPGRTASRERLIGWLWPESDSRRARHRLSVALHAIRKELGRDAVLTSGDSVVLNPSVVRTDAGEFLDAIEEGRLEDAVQLCAGPFLDGFYLKDGAEFERWAETERNRLAGLCRSALERLASEAETDRDPAKLVACRRRLATLSPYDSSLALALMNALVANGDAGGAIAHARAYATRVEADLGIPVNPDVLDLAEELTASVQDRRDRPEQAERVSQAEARPAEPIGASEPKEPATPASPPRPWRRWASASVAVAVTVGAIWLVASRGEASEGNVPSVVVFPFDDLGSEEQIGGTLASEIASTLSIVPNLEVRDAPELRPPNAAWRVLARRLRVGSAVTGTVRAESDKATVTVQLRDVSTGETLWESTHERGLRSTDARIEALSMLVADGLRSRLAPYIPHHYTDSESANESFLAGVYEHRKLGPEQMWIALQHYRRAWEIDPGFALAHAIAGNAYMGMPGLSAPDVGWERGREHVMRAIEIDPTLPEAYSILGRLQFWWDRDFEAAEATLRRAIMLYPTHPDARDTYAFYQLYYLGDFEGALANVRLALEVDPLNTGRSQAIETVLYHSRRFDQVAAQNEHTWSLDRDAALATSNYTVGGAYREMGMYEKAVAAYLSEQEMRGLPAPGGLGLTYALMGRTADARAVLHDREERSGPNGPTGTTTAALYAALGDVDRAFEILERGVDTRPSDYLHLPTAPPLDPLRADPRFDRLLQRMGFPVD